MNSLGLGKSVSSFLSPPHATACRETYVDVLVFIDIHHISPAGFPNFRIL